MRHRESELQIKCVSWFHYQYKPYSMLLEHPKNEGGHGHTQGAISKAEGVRAGVADLILHVPSYIQDPSVRHSDCYHSLALEMKTATGRQSPEQKVWQRLFEAAGSKYVLVRSYEDFVRIITEYMINVPMDIDTAVRETYIDIDLKESEKAVKQFKKLINK